MKLCQRHLQLHRLSISISHILHTQLSHHNELLSYASKRYFAQVKKTRKTLTPEEVRKQQMQRDQSGLLELAMKAEEEFYQTEGVVDLEKIQQDGEQIAKDLDTEHLREEDSLDDLDDYTSSYSPLTAQYSSILDYDAHAGILNII